MANTFKDYVSSYIIIMIIPIRCMTCGHVLADKWEYYVRECQKREQAEKAEEKKTPTNKDDKYFDGKIFTKEILDELGLYKQCCRRHMLGHVDLIETI